MAGLINGSEPVNIASIEKFTAAFAPYGLHRDGGQAVLRDGRGDTVRLDHIDTRRTDGDLLDPIELGAGFAVPR